MPLSTLEKEGKYLLTLNAYYNGQFQTINTAVTAYDVNYKTLLARSKGQLLRATCPPNSRKLTTIEEKTLENWILSLNAHRLPPYV